MFRINTLIIVLCVLFLPLTASFAAPRKATRSRAPALLIESEHPERDKNWIERFFRDMDRAAAYASFLNPGDNIIDCRIAFTEKKVLRNLQVFAGSKYLHIVLPSDLELWKDDFKIHSRLMSAMLLRRNGIKPDESPAGIPRWVAAGLLRRMARHGKGGGASGILLFPATRAFLLEGRYPDFTRMHLSSLDYSDKAAFEYFSETGELLLEIYVKEKNGRECFKNYLSMTAAGISHANALEKSITPLTRHFALKSGPGITEKSRQEEWIREKTRFHAMNLFSPGTAAWIRDRFREINKISCELRKGEEDDKSPKEYSICLLADLADKRNEISKPEIVLAGVLEKIAKLSFSSPQIANPALQKISNICGTALYADPDKYRTSMKIAEDNLYKELYRISRIEEYLFDSSRRYVPPAYRYNIYLETIREWEKLPFWPELDQYLAEQDESYGR